MLSKHYAVRVQDCPQKYVGAYTFLVPSTSLLSKYDTDMYSAKYKPALKT